MFLLIASFLAGILTSLAPCILPILPVIIGSAVLQDGDKKANKSKPYIIIGSLIASVIVFTLLLKVSTVLIGVDPNILLYISGGLVIIIGVTMLFPNLWLEASAKIGLEHSSNSFLNKSYQRGGTTGAILTGAALGPVFSSCSPVYAVILATILPVNLAAGMVYIITYALGLGLALLAIALLGRRLIKRITWAVNPSGTFRKVLGIILIIVGLLIVTGYDKRFQVWAAEHLPFNVSRLEQKLVPQDQQHALKPFSALTGDGGGKFNVAPYAAPELSGIVDFINTNPTTLAQLKGKVVLIDFWTYSCINCQRTQSHLNTWYDKYEKDGFVIIGVHAPEFAFEKVPENVRKAVKDENIKYPVVLDNDFKTWNAYHNQYWPAKFLIDKDGRVRYTHNGEGAYAETENNIQVLLKEAGKTVTAKVDTAKTASPTHAGQTPETYLNYSRGERFAGVKEFVADKAVDYHLPSQQLSDAWALGGSWKIEAEQTVATGDNSILRVKFSAKNLYLVMSGPGNDPVRVQLNGKLVTASEFGGKDVSADGTVTLDQARLYKLIDLPEFRTDQVIDITVPRDTIINALTFGG